jgi:hypothetical protein
VKVILLSLAISFAVSVPLLIFALRMMAARDPHAKPSPYLGRFGGQVEQEP